MFKCFAVALPSKQMFLIVVSLSNTVEAQKAALEPFLVLTVLTVLRGVTVYFGGTKCQHGSTRSRQNRGEACLECVGRHKP